MHDTREIIETAEQMQDAIVDAVGWCVFETPGEIGECEARETGEAFAEIFAGGSIDTFEHAGVMTTNAGVVVRTASGAEFQITIVRSR